MDFRCSLVGRQQQPPSPHARQAVADAGRQLALPRVAPIEPPPARKLGGPEGFQIREGLYGEKKGEKRQDELLIQLLEADLNSSGAAV